MFTTQRRFSLVTLSQAINCLLQSSAVVNAASGEILTNANRLKKTVSNGYLLFKYGSNIERRKK